MAAQLVELAAHVEERLLDLAQVLAQLGALLVSDALLLLDDTDALLGVGEAADQLRRLVLVALEARA